MRSAAVALAAVACYAAATVVEDTCSDDKCSSCNLAQSWTEDKCIPVGNAPPYPTSQTAHVVGNEVIFSSFKGPNCTGAPFQNSTAKLGECVYFTGRIWTIFKRQNASAALSTYTCSVCGHVYDPVADGGGKAFEDLPDSWSCPVCGSPKSAYKPTVVDGRKVWVHPEPQEQAKPAEEPLTTYTCSVCGHVYDPQVDGQGVPFEKLPDSWTCPVCGSPKSAYKPTVVNGKKVWVHN